MFYRASKAIIMFTTTSQQTFSNSVSLSYVSILCTAGIATGYGLDDSGVVGSSPGRVKNFHFSISRPDLRITQPPMIWILGALSPGVKWLGHETDHSPPNSAKVKKTWIYTSTPPHTSSWRSASSVKHRNYFIIIHIFNIIFLSTHMFSDFLFFTCLPTTVLYLFLHNLTLHEFVFLSTFPEVYK
jgi:hypothetical protein